MLKIPRLAPRGWAHRILAILLACVVALCTTQCASRRKADVVVWSWDIAARGLQSLVPAFQREHPGITVEVIDLGNQQVYDRGLAGCSVGGVDLPDVFSVENDRSELFWTRFPACWEDLSKMGADRYRKQFPSFKWAALTSGAKIFAIPWDAGPVVVFYRRDLYAKAGLDPRQIETWDDFLEAGRKMLAASGGKVRMGTIAQASDDEWFRMLANQNGSFYFDPTGQRITVNSPGCVRALETVARLRAADVLAVGDWGQQLQLIKDDRLASAMFGAWYEGTLRSMVPEQRGKWGVYAMPASRRGGVRAANIGGSALAIPASARNKQAAWAFVEFTMARAPSSIQMLREQGLVPSFLPALQDPYIQQPQPFWGDQAIWGVALRGLELIPPARGTQYFQEARQIVTVAQSDFLAGRYPSAQAALDAAATNLAQATGLPVAPKEAAP